MTDQQQPQTGQSYTKLLTLDEAAAILRTPKATLRYWRHLGTGPNSFKIGRRVVYRRGDVDDWVREQVAADRTRIAG